MPWKPLLKEIESLNDRIDEYDRRIEQIAKEVYPQVALLKQVKGVGTLIALTYILTLDDPYRFRRSREPAVFSVCVLDAGTPGIANHNYTSARKETVTYGH